MNILALNVVMEDCERNIAIVIEYEKRVSNSSLDVNSFSVAERNINRIYANDSAEQIKDGLGNDGRFVIIELDVNDEAAKVLTSENWKWKRVIPDYEIKQIKDIKYVDGEVCDKWENREKVQKLINEAFDGFTPDKFKDDNNGIELRYQLFTPADYDESKSYPIVLFFHGGGEKGDDNYVPLLASQGGIVWATKEEQEKHPCFILAPQCPKGGDWIDPDTYELTEYFNTVCRLFFTTVEKYNIDKKRLYVTGLSMGSMATWEINKRYPNVFAAAIISAGQDNYEGIEVLRDCNLWIFNPANDDKAMPGIVEIMDTFKGAGVEVAREVWDGALRGEEAKELAKNQIKKKSKIMHTQFKDGSITSGYAHTAAWWPVYSNEEIRNWFFSNVNYNFSMEEGIIKNNYENTPVKVELGFDGNEVKQIATGNRHNIALLKDGRVFSWGFNATGQLGNGAEGFNSDIKNPVLVEGLENIVQVAAGNNFSVALTKEGIVYGWGSNSCGQLGDDDLNKTFSRPKRIESIDNVKVIGCGDHYAIAVKNDGTVWGWGSNCSGQLGDGSYTRTSYPVQVINPNDLSEYLTDIIGIEVGVRTVMALSKDRNVYTWGDGEYGQIGNGKAGHGPGTTISTKVIDPNDKTGYVTEVVGLAEARVFSSILKENGDVYTWGWNRHGELGRGDYNSIAVPTKVEAIKEVKKIATGMNHLVMLKNDGTVWTCGYNKLMGQGVLGVGQIDNSNSPIQVNELKDIYNIYSGFNHVFAIQTDGTIWAWGNNNNFRLGNIKK